MVDDKPGDGTPVSGRETEPESARRGPEGTSVQLLRRARDGDHTALNALCALLVPPLRRWASGRLPRNARDLVETEDVVHETLMKTLIRLREFEPRREGALQAYLRQAVLNRIRDEIRRTRRRPVHEEINLGLSDLRPSPLDEAIGSDVLQQYEEALQRLRPKDREAVVMRVELDRSYMEIRLAVGQPSPEAARKAVARALVRLAKEMSHET